MPVASLSPLSSHLDPSFNRLCRICLAPLTFPQNPPARPRPPAIQPAARAHSLTHSARCGAPAVASPYVIPRFHFSKSRDIELRLRTSLCLPAASVLRPVRLGGDRERRRLQDVIPADTRGGGGGMAEDRGSPGRENEGVRGRQTAIHTRGAFQSDRDPSISLDFPKFPYFTPLAAAAG